MLHLRRAAAGTLPGSSTLALAIGLALVGDLTKPAAKAAEPARGSNPSTAADKAAPAAPAQDASATGVEGMDRERLRALFRKQNGGKTLTAEEQAYLDRAMGGASKRRIASPPADRSKSPSTFRPVISQEACPGY